MSGSERPSQATVPVLVILLGLSVAVLTFHTTRSAEDDARSAQFEQNASRYAQRLADGLTQQVDLLRFLATLYEREGRSLDRDAPALDMRLAEEDLRAFVDPVFSNDDRFASLVTVAWVQRVGPDELADYVRRRSVQHDEDQFRVRGLGSAGVDPGAVHDIVDQCCSRLSHEHAAGLDLASDPDLAEALASAASRVKPALSLPVSLFSHPEDPRRRDGVLVAVPVFVAGEGARALHEPRAVRGFIVGMFSLTVMLDQTIALFRDEPDAPQLHVTLKLKPGPPATPDAPSVPFAESGSPAIGGGSPSSTRQLFDRLWEIEVQPVTPTALTVDELLARPSTLLTASVCIMMLLFLWIAWTLSRRHRVIQQRVGEQTAELRQKNVVLEGKERELHEANRRLLEMSNTDPLTGILNRRAFEVQSDKERERALRTGVPCGLLIFDVDQFKDYNDRYGHAAGDEVLRRVAGIINAEARRIDTVARYGGEEFVVLAAGTDAVGLLALGERIRGRIQDAAIQHAAAPKGVITVSGGGSLSSAALGHDPKLAFEVADRCLYQAKSTGRNRVVMVM